MAPKRQAKAATKGTQTKVAGLSKSRLMNFRQCPRRLWLSVHRRDLTEGLETSAVMRVGHNVGEIARSLHEGGQLIGEEGDLGAALRETEVALQARSRRVLFEATVQHEGVLVRADLLKPVRGGWDLIEVKSATSVKPHYHEDLAIQAHVFGRAGIRIRRTVLQYINTQFVYPGEGCYHEQPPRGRTNSLFQEEDLTEAVRPLAQTVVAKWVESARSVLAQSVAPPVTGRCAEPYPCPYVAFCYGEEDPEAFPLHVLPGIRAARIEALEAEGYRDIRDLPEGCLTNANQERVRSCTQEECVELRPGADKVLNALPYPRYYLDFETANPAIPLWAGRRPYQRLPFQWSCHRESRSGRLTHQEFLDLSGNDPLRGFTESVLAATGTAGPVLVYNAGFEGSVLRDLSVCFPERAAALKALIARLVDLLPLTRRHYYHPQMRGSWSLKRVLPTIAPELDYAALDTVQTSGDAPEAFLEAVAPETSAARRRVLDQALRRYCARDTEATVRLAHFLCGPAGRSPIRPVRAGRRRRS